MVRFQLDSVVMPGYRFLKGNKVGGQRMSYPMSLCCLTVAARAGQAPQTPRQGLKQLGASLKGTVTPEDLQVTNAGLHSQPDLACQGRRGQDFRPLPSLPLLGCPHQVPLRIAQKHRQEGGREQHPFGASLF